MLREACSGKGEDLYGGGEGAAIPSGQTDMTENITFAIPLAGGSNLHCIA